MTKLKTLKDLKKANSFPTYDLNSKDLKQESIKLIKILRKDFRDKMPWDTKGVAHDGELIRFIMWRDNLTEEDLA